MGLLSLDHYHFYFLMIFKETLTFMLLSNLVLQYWEIANDKSSIVLVGVVSL